MTGTAAVTGPAAVSGPAAVYAHFDPHGLLAPHVSRALAQYAEATDRLVIVSTADPGPGVRRELAGFGELVVRENVGYDFASWQAGIERLGPLAALERLVLANDSVVGPLTPLRAILARPPAADYWGMTTNNEIAPHVQSWFMVYEAAALQDGLVQGFWTALRPESHRYQVIRRYEVGQSTLLRRAGLRLGSWYEPSPYESVRAEYLYRRWLRGQDEARHAREDSVHRGRRHGRVGRWNPAYACWEAALSGRLPFVKTELLRDSPMGVDSEAVLRRLELALPAAFAGVRDYVDRTKSDVRSLRRVA